MYLTFLGEIFIRCEHWTGLSGTAPQGYAAVFVRRCRITQFF